ncbi:hypothetical protein BDV59DRAFT_210367 [Aspergillus ambiguus]|uniref:uncharacterized protein n=1 Tax=Aspergillus ambiguus TaxID=176160 RepID=UPI003CCCB26D
MVFTITIDSDHQDLDSSLEEDDSSGVLVEPRSDAGSHVSEDPYEGWAGKHYADELKPSDSARKPRRREGHRARGRRVPSPESVESASSYIDDNGLICSGDKDKDITVHLDLDASLDINHDIERLARLCRLGHFSQAAMLFEERLAPHVDFFPVVAEYADLLLEQEDYGHLHKFISSRLLDPHVKFSDEEVLLLKLLKSLAEIHTRGALIPALEMTIEVQGRFGSQSCKHTPWSRRTTGSRIQLMEACVRIIAYAALHSNFLENGRFHTLLYWSFCNEGVVWADDNSDNHYRRHFRRTESRPNVHAPVTPSNPKPESAGHNAPFGPAAPRRNHPQFGDWYRFLVQEGHLWESHRILRSMLPLFGCSNGHYIADGAFEEFFQINEITKAGDVFLQPEGAWMDDEQVLLTEFANASLLAGFLNADSTLETVRTTHSQFYKKSHSLASNILSRHPHLVNSRPYLNWMLLESARELAARRLQLPVAQQRPILEIGSHGVFSRVQSLQQRIPSIAEEAEVTQTSTSLLLRNLEIVSASAKELGDYHLEKLVLQKVCQHTRDFSQSFQAVQTLARLHHDTLQDAPGYLQSLIDEYLLLDSANSTGRDEMRKDLHRRLTEFNGSFPFRYDHITTVHHNPAILLFDNPLLKWMERRVSYLLLKGLSRDVEAELARAQLPNIEGYLPKQVLSQLNYPFTQREHNNHSGHQSHPLAPPAPWLPASGPINPIVAPRVILPESHRNEATNDNTVAELEKLILQNRKKRNVKREMVTKLEREEEKAKEQERQMYEKRIYESERRRRIAEERARTAEAARQNLLGREQQLLTLKDPVGRTFVFPFDQCRTFTTTKELMQQVFLDDAILSPHISQGDYEFTGPHDSPISPEDWESVVQPGWTITMHFKSDPEQKLSQTPKKGGLGV